MFAGLPGIGVGTLFYILTALWMPVREIGATLRGRSTRARWRLIAIEIVFAAGIIASIASADWILTHSFGLTGSGMGPARWIHDQIGSRAPQSILAAPLAASLLLLAAVLIVVEVSRAAMAIRRAMRGRELDRASGNRALLVGAATLQAGVNDSPVLSDPPV